MALESLEKKLENLYQSIQPAITDIAVLYRCQMTYEDDLLKHARIVVEQRSEFRLPEPQRRVPRTRGTKRKSSSQGSEGTVEEMQLKATVEEKVDAAASSQGTEQSPSPEPSSRTSSEKENFIPSVDVPAAKRSRAIPVQQGPTSPGGGTMDTEPRALPPVPDLGSSSKVIAAKTPRQAREKLRQVSVPSAKRTPAPKNALFSPYGKFSTREKAQAFEQRVALSPLKAIPESQRTAVVILENELRQSCEVHEAKRKSPRAVCKADVAVTPNIPVNGHNEQPNVLQHYDVDVTDESSGGSSTKGQKKTVKKGKKQKKPTAAPPRLGPAKVTNAKPTDMLKKAHARSSSTSFSVAPLVHTTPKSTAPSPGAKGALGPYRLGAKQFPGSQVKQTPSGHQRKVSATSLEREKERKMERMKLKSEETKKKRESRAARVRAAKKQQEEKALIEQLEREQREQLKNQERQEKRKAFHQRTQSEREREIAGRSNQVKRKGNSPADPTRKKVQLDSSRTKLRIMPDNSRTASQLLFFEPTTSLSNKVKLNNSLQQQALLNCMSMSLRGDQPDSSPHENVITTEQPQPTLNVTYVAEEKHNTTYNVEVNSDTVEVPRTPATKNAPLVPSAKDPASYDITPHHSELPPAPNVNPDNYDIADFTSGDETDDEERPRKEVPLWAIGQRLKKAVQRQFHSGWDDVEAFGKLVDVNLASVFKVQKKYFEKRTSSALWTSPIARPST